MTDGSKGSQTWHEYTYPGEPTLHWHALRAELTKSARVTEDRLEVTCCGCLEYLKRMEKSS